jgi:hypothetical protein
MLKQRIKYYISSSHVVTDDPGFKHWFRGSKLVNKNGSPMMVFHGTGRDFKQFAPSQSESGHRTSGIGIWFTDDPSAAHTFAAFARGPDIIRPCYLKLRNPKIYVADGKIDSFMVFRQDFNRYIRYWQDTYDPSGDHTLPAAKDKDGNATSYPSKRDNAYDIVDLKGFVKSLKAKGYDGLIVKDTITDANPGTLIDQIVVFSPDQIRSAI